MSDCEFHLPTRLFEHHPTSSVDTALRARANIVRCTRCEKLGLFYHQIDESRDIDWAFFPDESVDAFRREATQWNEDADAERDDGESSDTPL